MAIAPSSHVVSSHFSTAASADQNRETSHDEEPVQPADRSGSRNAGDEKSSRRAGPAPKRAVRLADGSSRVYHRIAEVREQQGISIRTLVRRTGMDSKELRRQEDPSTDLTLGQLQVWQQILEVPLTDLIVDSDQPLSPPVQQRAQLLKIMKTALSIDEHAVNQRVKRLSTMLKEQLIALMPELTEVTAWPTYGQRRGAENSGRIEEQQIAVRNLSLEYDGD